jgi:hypothetical protein
VSTLVLIFIRMEAKGELAVCLFNLCIGGLFGDSEYVVIVFFEVVGGNFLPHLLLLLIGHYN